MQLNFISKKKKDLFVSELRKSLRTNYIVFAYFIAGIFAIIKILFLTANIFKDPKFYIPIAISVFISSITLAVVTFNYAAVLDYPKKNRVVRIGAILFLSPLNLIFGIIFIALSREEATNIFNLPEFWFDSLIFFTSGLLLILGGISLIFSAACFAAGITLLLDHLMKEFSNR